MADKKERILELLRNGVISEDEAIELLEKSGESTDDFKSSKKEEDGYTAHDVDFAEAMKNTFQTVADSLRQGFQGVTKVVNDNVEFGNGFPKIKRTKKTIEKDLAGNFDSVFLEMTSGKVVVRPGDNAHVKADFTVYGAIENGDIDAFLAENTTLSVEENELTISAVKRVGVDLELYLPQKNYQELTLKLTNGVIDASQLTADKVEILVKNGEMTVLDSKVKDLKMDLINGNIKFDGSLEDGDVSLVNGNILLTQTTTDAKKLKVKNVNGDVKLAVPESLGLVGHVKTNFGGYKTRLRLDNPFETGRNGAAVVRSGDDALTFEMETKSGTIWLKDNTAD